MNALRNKVQLIGFLGGDPDVRDLGEGKKLARMRMATNETYKNQDGERITETQWHSLIAWGKLAEIAEQILSKGAEIVAEGKLVSRDFTDKEGNRRFITEVHLNELLLLRRKE